MSLRITVKDPENESYWYVEVSTATATQYDNGALFSCGWTVGKDLPRRTFTRLPKTRTTERKYTHSSCQSSCVLRGNTHCRW